MPEQDPFLSSLAQEFPDIVGGASPIQLGGDNFANSLAQEFPDIAGGINGPIQKPLDLVGTQGFADLQSGDPVLDSVLPQAPVVATRAAFDAAQHNAQERFIRARRKAYSDELTRANIPHVVDSDGRSQISSENFPSFKGSFARALASNAPESAASIFGYSVGSNVGGGLGAMTGPAAPVAAPVLGVGLGLATGAGAKYIVHESQQALLNKAALWRVQDNAGEFGGYTDALASINNPRKSSNIAKKVIGALFGGANEALAKDVEFAPAGNLLGAETSQFVTGMKPSVENLQLAGRAAFMRGAASEAEKAAFKKVVAGVGIAAVGNVETVARYMPEYLAMSPDERANAKLPISAKEVVESLARGALMSEMNKVGHAIGGRVGLKTDKYGRHLNDFGENKSERAMRNANAVRAELSDKRMASKQFDEMQNEAIELASVARQMTEQEAEAALRRFMSTVRGLNASPNEAAMQAAPGMFTAGGDPIAPSGIGPLAREPLGSKGATTEAIASSAADQGRYAKGFQIVERGPMSGGYRPGPTALRPETPAKTGSAEMPVPSRTGEATPDLVMRGGKNPSIALTPQAKAAQDEVIRQNLMQDGIERMARATGVLAEGQPVPKNPSEVSSLLERAMEAATGRHKDPIEFINEQMPPPPDDIPFHVDDDSGILMVGDESTLFSAPVVEIRVPNTKDEVLRSQQLSRQRDIDAAGEMGFTEEHVGGRIFRKYKDRYELHDLSIRDEAAYAIMFYEAARDGVKVTSEVDMDPQTRADWQRWVDKGMARWDPETNRFVHDPTEMPRSVDPAPSGEQAAKEVVAKAAAEHDGKPTAAEVELEAAKDAFDANDTQPIPKAAVDEALAGKKGDDEGGGITLAAGPVAAWNATAKLVGDSFNALKESYEGWRPKRLTPQEMAQRKIGENLLRQASATRDWHYRMSAEDLNAFRNVFQDNFMSNLKSFSKGFRDKRTSYRYDFIHRMETGQPQLDPVTGKKSPELTRAAAAVREHLDAAFARAQAALPAGKTLSFLQDYFPHLWENPKANSVLIQSILSKRPMEGPKSFTRERVHQLFIDGINAGLKPITSNPIDLALLKIHEINRFTMAHSVMSQLEKMGLSKTLYGVGGEPTLSRKVDADGNVSWVRQNAPKGYKPVHDAIGKVRALGPERNVRGEPGAKIADLEVIGNKYVPEPIANLLDTYLAPGIRNNGKWSGSILSAYMPVANMMNAFQLGMSAFHLGFTTLDAVTSKVALGIEQLYAGKFNESAKSLAPFALAAGSLGVGAPSLALISSMLPAVHNVMRGHVLEHAYSNKAGIASGKGKYNDFMNKMASSPEYQRLVDSLVKGGGGVSMSDLYRTGSIDTFWRAVESGKKSAVLHAPFAAMEAVAKPMMEWLVPRQKLGVFADMARFEMSRLPPGASDAQVREVMGKVWDSVDNRLGQIRWDNVFWSRTYKEIASTLFRSPGWQLGIMREFAGGFGDIPRGIKNRDASAGGLNRFMKLSHKTAYKPSLVATAMLFGAITGYLYGQPPNELIDYFLPKTGRKNPDGTDERIQLPTYMKDFFGTKSKIKEHGLAGGLAHEVTAKFHPAAKNFWELLSNEDWKGDQIYEHGAKGAGQAAMFVANQFWPFSIDSMRKQMKQGSTFGQAAPNLMGVTKAPASMMRTPMQSVLHQAVVEQGHGGNTIETTEKRQLVNDLVERERKGQYIGTDVVQAVRTGMLSLDEAMKLYEKAGMDPAMIRFKAASLPVAREAWKVASPEEKKKFGLEMQRKEWRDIIGQAEARIKNRLPVPAKMMAEYRDAKYKLKHSVEADIANRMRQAKAKAGISTRLTPFDLQQMREWARVDTDQDPDAED